MKRSQVLFVAVILVLSGCAPTLTSEEQFLRDVRAGFVDQANSTDREFLSLGVGVCSALESGVSEDELLEIGQSVGMTKGENRIVVAAAKKYLCE